MGSAAASGALSGKLKMEIGGALVEMSGLKVEGKRIWRPNRVGTDAAHRERRRLLRTEKPKRSAAIEAFFYL
jgi:hypothetical protein